MRAIVRNLVFALHIRQIKRLCYCDSNDCSIQSVDGGKESNSIPVFPRSFGELKLQRSHQNFSDFLRAN